MENNYHYQSIAKIIQFISENYTEQPDLDTIAKQIHLNPFHVQRLFQKWAGLSPKQFLQYITIQHAKKSLEKGKSTLATAHQVGLSGNGRLHDLFIKIEACTPGEFKKRGAGLTILFDFIETPFGLALVAETEKGICQLNFIQSKELAKQQLNSAFPNATLKNELGFHSSMVAAYFQHWTLPENKIKLDLKGTPFQIQVWNALLQIPSGQLCAYQDIANLIQKPKANRAVGTAIGNNPVGFLIPCHRVIKSTGAFGNYRWNSERKVAMHAFETSQTSLLETMS